MKQTLLTLLITLSITSCAGLNDYAKYPVKRNYVEQEPTVIDKLESCTEKYISRLGVSPSEAYGICDSIYRSR